MDDAKHAADLFLDLFFKEVVYGFNTLHLLHIPSHFLFFEYFLIYSSPQKISRYSYHLSRKMTYMSALITRKR